MQAKYAKYGIRASENMVEWGIAEKIIMTETDSPLPDVWVI